MAAELQRAPGHADVLRPRYPVGGKAPWATHSQMEIIYTPTLWHHNSAGVGAGLASF